MDITPEQKRDDILLRLLKTPPQPRPKRDRTKDESASPKRQTAKSKKRVPDNEH